MNDWIDVIFTKLSMTYGRDFLGRWEGLDLEDVKSDWAHELRCFDGKPEAIKYVLQNLPVKAPTVVEFKMIGARRPPDVFKALPPAEVDKEKVRQILDQCRKAMKK